MGAGTSPREEEQAAADAMRASQKVRLLVEQAPVAIALFDRELRYVATSARWRAEYERGRGDVIGKHVHYVHPSLTQAAREAFERGLAGEAAGKDEDRWRRQDGTVIWVSWAVQPWTDEQGRIEGIIVAYENITARKRVEESLRESEARFATVFHSGPAGIVLTRLSDDVIVDANETFLRFIDYTKDEVVGHTAVELAAWPDPEERVAMMGALRKGGRVQNLEVHLRRKSGEVRYALVAVERIELQGEAYALGMMADITETKRAETELRASEARFRTLVDQAGDAIFVHDRDGRIVDVNRHACEALGYTREELLALHVTDMERDLDADGVRRTFDLVRPGEQLTLSGHHRRKDGSIFPVEVRLGRIELEGEPFVIALARDVSQRRELALVEEANRRLAEEIERRAEVEKELARSLAHAEHQARTDALTGVASRPHVLALGSDEVTRAHRYGHPMSLLMCDLDYFKGINDEYGHAAGDAALRAFAEACRAVLRSVDAVGRLGGEEFAILLPDTDYARALTVAERLRKEVASRDVSLDDGTALRFTVSIGVSSLRSGEALPALLKRADVALYEAKSAGRDRVEGAV